MFSKFFNKIKNEPVAAGVIARAIVPVLALAGLDISVEQLITIILAIEIIAGYFIRASVTPVSKSE